MNNQMTNAELESEMKSVAFMSLNSRDRVLAPASEATIEYREYDPCRVIQVIATVHWPATVACKEVILRHHILDGDLIVPKNQRGIGLFITRETVPVGLRYGLGTLGTVFEDEMANHTKDEDCTVNERSDQGRRIKP